MRGRLLGTDGDGGDGGGGAEGGGGWGGSDESTSRLRLSIIGTEDVAASGMDNRDGAVVSGGGATFLKCEDGGSGGVDTGGRVVGMAELEAVKRVFPQLAPERLYALAGVE